MKNSLASLLLSESDYRKIYEELPKYKANTPLEQGLINALAFSILCLAEHNARIEEGKGRGMVFMGNHLSFYSVRYSFANNPLAEKLI